MTALVISNAAPFGSATNSMVAGTYSLGEAIARLNAAVATASSGFTGTPGAEFEDGSNFGVAADPTTPGKAGSDYAYAIGQLTAAWNTFWTAARPSIEQLDNGVRNV